MYNPFSEINEWYNDLCEMVHDPNYDITKNNYHIVEDVRDFFDTMVKEYDYRLSNYEPLIADMLLRVRNASKTVYAITVGQFPGYEHLEDMWKRNGYMDITGYTWLAPA